MRSLALPLAFAALALAGCGPTDNPVVEVEGKSRHPDTGQAWEGTFEAELYPDKAHQTVKNFLSYVDEGHYDGTTFHRVVNGYVIQGGHYRKGFSEAESEREREGFAKKTREPIENESDNGLKNKRFTLAMARSKSAGAADQFFINAADNDGLDRAPAKDEPGYCVFGKVIAGKHVVDRIKRVRTRSVGGLDDVPAEEVVIESVRRVR